MDRWYFTPPRSLPHVPSDRQPGPRYRYVKPVRGGGWRLEVSRGGRVACRRVGCSLQRGWSAAVRGARGASGWILSDAGRRGALCGSVALQPPPQIRVQATSGPPVCSPDVSSRRLHCAPFFCSRRRSRSFLVSTRVRSAVRGYQRLNKR